jgi:hypothetical protein
LYHQYRHCPKQTFDEIIDGRSNATCSVPKEDIYGVYSERYQTPARIPARFGQYSNRFPIKTLGTIEDQELKQVISHFNKSSSPTAVNSLLFADDGNPSANTSPEVLHSPHLPA